MFVQEHDASNEFIYYDDSVLQLLHFVAYIRV